MDQTAKDLIKESLWNVFKEMDSVKEQLEGEWEYLTPSIDTIMDYVGFEGLMEHDIITDFGVLTLVETRGGEGDGAPLHVVVQLGERFFQLDGTYSSWDSDWWEENFYEVFPKEVTVIQFERKA